LSRTKIRVLAVPRSMARSVEKYRRKAPNIRKSSFLLRKRPLPRPLH
jgi:hypothetical protein